MIASQSLYRKKVEVRNCSLCVLAILTRSIAGRVTQLIALTGPSGAWRKPIIDKAVACVLEFTIKVAVY